MSDRESKPPTAITSMTDWRLRRIGRDLATAVRDAELSGDTDGADRLARAAEYVARQRLRGRR